jgi:hypothetical protein
MHEVLIDVGMVANGSTKKSCATCEDFFGTKEGNSSLVFRGIRRRDFRVKGNKGTRFIPIGA